ncbi:MAG: AEC family transporter [Steroidobacteraceae bacterium]|nr:AEC family transporter [Steroidobacteraceae bacterium]
MFFTSFAVLLPVLFVMILGYWAGHRGKFSADQVKGINDIVLDYALPALMFVGIVQTTRDEMAAEVPFLIVIFLAFVGLFIVVLLFSLRVRRHSLGAAALQANLVSLPSVAFIGTPIFRGLFGESGLVSITFATVLGLVTIVPLTVVLLEIHAKKVSGGETDRLSELVRKSLVTSFRKPMVWAPLSAVTLTLLNVPTPKEVDDMLELIGSATGGLSLFLAGLIIAAYRVRLSGEVIGNVLVKMSVQPLLMVAFVSTLAVDELLGRQAIVICAIPSAVLAPLLAPRYHVYESESASTLVLTTLTMIVTLPVAIFLTGR